MANDEIGEEEVEECFTSDDINPEQTIINYNSLRSCVDDLEEFIKIKMKIKK